MPHVEGHSRHSHSNHRHHHHHHDDNAEFFLMCLSTCFQCCVGACVALCEEASRQENNISASSTPSRFIMTDQDENHQQVNQQELKSEILALLHSLDREMQENTMMSLRIRQAGQNVLVEGKALIDESSDIVVLNSVLESLNCAADVIRNPHHQDKIQRLHQNAEQAIGHSSAMKKFIGTLVCLVGAAMVVLAIAGVPFTGSASFGLSFAGPVVFACGAALFYSGREKSMSKALHELEQSTLKI